MIIFTHPERPTQMLLKITARVGDDLWILHSGTLLGTIVPTTKSKALRRLTPKNGWTQREVNIQEGITFSIDTLEKV